MPESTPPSSSPVLSLAPPCGLPFFVAHTPRRGTTGPWHRLDDHALAVARLAREFARSFGGEVWAEYIGRLHDLGKFDDGFQSYLWQCHRADQERGAPRPRPGSAPHKQAGALVAEAALKGHLRHLSQPLYGHHGGMHDPNETTQESLKRQTLAKNSLETLRARARSVHPDLDPVPPSGEDIAALGKSLHGKSALALEMFFRFLFSCLTDADALDTERHLNPDEADRRRQAAASAPTIESLRDRLRERQADLLGTAVSSVVNTVRRAVYEDCVRAAVSTGEGSQKGGIYTLTVPTGGGKTRSSLAFVLEHAAKRGLSRVVYAIPFTSIVDQTASVFEDSLFDGMPGAVLEHHSAIDLPEEEASATRQGHEAWRRLAAQNWDAPLIVTTTVQLFESLFGGRPGKCRKLHRLANSAIVLDEVQSLPPELLEPLTDGLRLLAENFGATVVLCTATQPALARNATKNPFLTGFDPPPAEIITEPTQHFDALRRVRYHLPSEPWDWPRVAAQMRTGDAISPVRIRSGSALCIVNTRRQALDLLSVLDPGGTDAQVLHLSTLLCGRHRRAVLADVRESLRQERDDPEAPPVLLVSTQVVEAGVDVDFPRVLRALGPLPSIIQAAGRCNREGRRQPEDSPVTVFRPEDDRMPPGLYALARQKTVHLLDDFIRHGITAPDFDDPALVTRWFADYYADVRQGQDAFDVQKARAAFRYGTVAQSVRLIRDDTVAVLPLRYDPDTAEAILKEADHYGRMTSELWRRLQPLLVNVYTKDVQRLSLEERHPGLFLWPGKYDQRVGLAAVLQDPGSGALYEPADLMG